MVKDKDGLWNRSQDFDRVTAERDAALGREAELREELKKSGSADHLRARVAFLTKEIHAMPERPVAHQIADYLATAAARQNGELATERDIFKAEVDRLLPEIDALQQRLTAADERADVLEELLREVQKSARKQDWASGYPTLFASVDAALKPAEGGGNYVKHYECIGKGGDYTIVAIAQGAGTLKGFNHYVYKNADGVHFVRDPEDFLSRMQIKP
jgi:hypothetical protein